MSKRKRTPEEREQLRKLIEDGREARRYMQEVLDWVEARMRARGEESSGPWPPGRREV